MSDLRTNRPGRPEAPGQPPAESWAEVALRLRKCWSETQELAAWRAGVSPRTWSAWERGQKRPGWRNRMWLAAQARLHAIALADRFPPPVRQGATDADA